MSQRENRQTLRTITLEEHYASPKFMEGPGRTYKVHMSEIAKKLCDLGDERIAAMDAAGIDMQVLSLTSPGVEQFAANQASEFAREANDILSEAIGRHPDRLAGFATIPTAAPERAADELERMIKQHNFKGAVINGHVQGRYLDDQFFWPILERAEALQVPIYLHPTQPPQAVIEASYSGFSPEVTSSLATGAWGWHIETGLHIIRMILGGVFDRYPHLQIIIGHLGEGLPFMLQRMNRLLPTEITKLKRPMEAYLRQNLHYTFSGFNFTPTFLDLLLEVGVERIMFSADYPFASMEEARTFLEKIPVSPADRERIAHGNAERLLRL